MKFIGIFSFRLGYKIQRNIRLFAPNASQNVVQHLKPSETMSTYA